MISVDIKSLLSRLNPYCTRCLEAAAGLCVSRTHYEVTVEHLLAKLLEEPQSDLSLIIRQFDLDAGRLARAIDQTLEEFRSGNAGRPVFSPLILDWFQEAWLTASIDLDESRIRSGALLMALLTKPRQLASGRYIDLLQSIGREALLQQFGNIVKNSLEQSSAAKEEGEPGRPAETTALGRFCLDFTDKARKGEIDPVFGRDREIRQMVDILARRRKNNPIVVGEAGVGKTAVVEGLARRVVEGDVPDILRGVSILGLDMGLLQAGAGVKGEFENRLKSVINEIKASPQPIILFIDEAHTLIGAGGSAGGSDAANLLKPALARGELRTIAATTWSEYKKYFEKDAALARRFQLVKLDEPSVDTAVLILRGLKDKYEETHGVVVRDDAIVAAAEFSSRYISGRQLPDKAVDLLDTSAARVKILLSSKPDTIEDRERAIQAIERELTAIKRDQTNGIEVDEGRLQELPLKLEQLSQELGQLKDRWLKEQECARRLVGLRKELSDLKAQNDSADKGADLKTQNGSADKGADDHKTQNDSADKEADLKARNDSSGKGAELKARNGSADKEAELKGKIEAASDHKTQNDSADKEAELKGKIEAASVELESIQAGSPLVSIEVDPDMVARVVSDWTGIPLGKVQRDEANAIINLADNLRKRIKGQDEAISAISQVIKAAKSGLTDPGQPMGVFLLVGPSGVGKTETGLAIADLLFGGERFMTTINMSEFQEKHTVSRLIGSPPGYVGYGEGGVLTEAVRQRPYSVVLLDEVEKAHLEVMNLFYQVFDKGTLSDGEGRIIDFKNTIILLTSNLASDVISQFGNSGEEKLSLETITAAVRPILSNHFKPALLARMTIVPFITLGPEFMKEIVVLKLEKLARRLAESHKMKFVYSPEVVNQIATRCTEVETGARNIDHIMRGTILPQMSQEILARLGEGAMPSEVHLGLAEEGLFTITFGE